MGNYLSPVMCSLNGIENSSACLLLRSQRGQTLTWTPTPGARLHLSEASEFTQEGKEVLSIRIFVLTESLLVGYCCHGSCILGLSTPLVSASPASL